MDCRETVIVSACLLGVKCRYDGSAATSKRLIERLKGEAVLAVCPEELGGLPTPRCPAEIDGGSGEDVLAGRSKVLRTDGQDVTAEYVRGAEEVARLGKLLGVKKAYLKSESPACGFGKIKQKGKLVEGSGVCAALLSKMGVEVIAVDEEER